MIIFTFLHCNQTLINLTFEFIDMTCHEIYLTRSLGALRAPTLVVPFPSKNKVMVGLKM